MKTGASWIDYIEKIVFETITKKQPNAKSFVTIKSEVSEIAKFCKLKIDGLLDHTSTLEEINGDFKYDILKWIDEGATQMLHEYEFSFKKQKLSFEFSKEQIMMRNDVFKRYGKDINALSKIVTRISNLEGQFRKVRYEEKNELRDIYKKMGDEWSVKYAMSG